MSRAFVRKICETLPGAELTDPWGGGHDVWKVGGKMFAVMGTEYDGVSVKTSDPEFARMMIEAGDARRASHMHASWVFLPWGTLDDLLRDRLIISYDIIRAGLTKKAQAALPPRPEL
ncbi:MmcQ/YjbR family DNA-binding protein [Pseudooceanicola sp. C21-150M6]|uniref:MmcQ/YjbR family DNA-binding protein n=1 Tax=Pseudooceanicola sp. C21-150M6 TaxID=3434355 RepID=UPI003D7FCAC0